MQYIAGQVVDSDRYNIIRNQEARVATFGKKLRESERGGRG